MPKTPDYFHGKTIIITGAGGGIGRSTALIFAREGANVVCADIDPHSARRTAETIQQSGGRALAVPTDVTVRRQVEELVQQTIAAYGQVDFQFNCAGAAIRRSKFLEIDDTLFEKTFAVNVNSVLYGMQAVLPHMLEKGFGVIAQARRAGCVGALCCSQGRGAEHDLGRRAGVCRPRHTLPVDLTGADQHGISGGRRHLA
jgi:NAD(P)-dependent dehydrogenase (short-subunit alcohol dehydrogenase family)